MLDAQVVFVPDLQDGRLYTFSIASNGALTPLGSFSGMRQNPYAVATDPTGRFRYTANAGSNDVTAYRIGAGGTLTSIAAPFPAGANPTSIAVEPFGLFVYVTNCGSNRASAYTIGSMGALTPAGTAAAGMCPSAVAVDPAGRFVYVASSSGRGVVSAYSIGPGGALTPVSGPAVSTGGGFTALAVDPTGRFLYATSSLSNGVFAFGIGDDGTLSAIGSNSVNGGPYPVPVDPLGRFVYVASSAIRETEQVFPFRIGPTGLLSPTGSPTATGPLPVAIVVEPAGQFAYVVNSGVFSRFSNVTGFDIGADGSLTELGSLPVGIAPHSIAVEACPAATSGYVPPSVTSMSASPAVLWPPDAKLVDALVRYLVLPRCGPPPSCTLNVASNQPAAENDWVILDAHRLELRAARSGTGGGRIYTITATCTDSFGSRARQSTTVTVPLNQGK